MKRASTTQPASWIEAGLDGFGLANLPYGSAIRPDGRQVLVTRVGNHVIDLCRLAHLGLLSREVADALDAPDLGRLLEAPSAVWSVARSRLRVLLDNRCAELRDHGEVSSVVLPLADVRLTAPIQVTNFADFFSSEAHAINLGRLFRPDGDALLPQWRHIPMTYHGRPGTIVPSGSPIRRPWGPITGESETAPTLRPTAQLDYEAELGYVLGGSTPVGSPVTTQQAEHHIFGVVLLNDWSARDIQRYEYIPFGPFLGKSMATTIGHWVVPMEALSRHRVAGPSQHPAVMPYLRASSPWALDIEITIELTTTDGSSTRLSTVHAGGLYWNAAQLLAHSTVNGASIAAGDLLGSGTISDLAGGGVGSLLELSHGGGDPVRLTSGQFRSFLEDDDRVVISGCAPRGDGREAIALGTVEGTVQPAIDAPWKVDDHA